MFLLSAFILTKVTNVHNTVAQRLTIQVRLHVYIYIQHILCVLVQYQYPHTHTHKITICERDGKIKSYQTLVALHSTQFTYGNAVHNQTRRHIHTHIGLLQSAFSNGSLGFNVNIKKEQAIAMHIYTHILQQC